MTADPGCNRFNYHELHTKYNVAINSNRFSDSGSKATYVNTGSIKRE